LVRYEKRLFALTIATAEQHKHIKGQLRFPDGGKEKFLTFILFSCVKAATVAIHGMGMGQRLLH